MVQANQSLKQASLRDYVATLFATNPASARMRSVGLELELLPLQIGDRQTPATVAISEPSGIGILDILKKSAKASSELEYSPQEDGTPLFKSADGGNITFEPGGQLEYSSSACDSAEGAIAEMVKNVDIVSTSFKQENIQLLHGGMNPWHSVTDVGLKMQKSRYREMDRYFQELGRFGQEMMRLTLSLQINLDFGDPETARRRWIASNLLSPLMCAIFGNSPFHQNRTTGFKSYRSFIWQNLDHGRTGFPNPEKLSSSDTDSVDQYLSYALDAHVIKLYHDAVRYGEKARLVSFRQWLVSGHPRLHPDMNEWINHINLLFPEIRPKGFIEFRTIDGPSGSWWTVPVVLLTTLLYDAAALDQVITLLSCQSENLDKMLRKASEAGVSAFPQLVKKVFRIGLESSGTLFTPELVTHCERFFKALTVQDKNPADLLLEINNGNVPSPGQFQDHDKRSLESLSPPDFAIFS